MVQIPSRVPRGRLIWVDLAKGICIILVVVVHVTNKHYLLLDVPDSLKHSWDMANASFGPLRMPLFFLVSGMLAASAVRRPWRETIQPRILRPYYLYAIWSLISFGIYVAIDSEIDGSAASSILGVLTNLVLPTSSLWYLYALVFYFAVAKTGLTTNRRFVFGGAMLVAVGVSFWPVSVPLSIAANLIFFLAGAYGSDFFRALADNATPIRVLGALGAYGVVVVLYAVGASTIPGVRPLGSFVAVYSGITVIAVLSRCRWLVSAGAYIGRNTLPIYVLHIPMLALFTEFWRWTPGQSSPLVVAGVYPLIVVAGVIATALGARRLLERIGAGWLFSFPFDKRRLSTHAPRQLESR